MSGIKIGDGEERPLLLKQVSTCSAPLSYGVMLEFDDRGESTWVFIATDELARHLHCLKALFESILGDEDETD